MFRTPSGKPAWRSSCVKRLGGGRRVLRGLPDHGVAAQQRGDQVPGGDRDREVAGRDDRGDAHRYAEREELLVGHLARDGLAVEPPSLAQEEVAGVDDLLHLAARLAYRLADLARDQGARAPRRCPRRGDRAAGSPGRAPARARPPTRAAPRAPCAHASTSVPRSRRAGPRRRSARGRRGSRRSGGRRARRCAHGRRSWKRRFGSCGRWYASGEGGRRLSRSRSSRRSGSSRPVQATGPISVARCPVRRTRYRRTSSPGRDPP